SSAELSRRSERSEWQRIHPRKSTLLLRQARARQDSTRRRRCGRPWASTSAASTIAKPPLEARRPMTHNLPNRGMGSGGKPAVARECITLTSGKLPESAQAPLREPPAAATVFSGAFRRRPDVPCPVMTCDEPTSETPADAAGESSGHLPA